MTINRITETHRDALCIAGIEKNLSAASSLALVGTTFTPTALVALIKSRVEAVAALAREQADLQARRDALRALSAQVTLVERGLRELVVNTFGVKSPVLADFGFAATARKPLTPEQKLARAAKAKATRAARGTRGPKSRLAVTGDVTGVVVTPVEGHAAAAPVPVKPA